MSTESTDREPPDRQTRGSAGMMVVWLLVALFASYFGLFALLCIDDFVMQRKMILEPLQAAAPDFAERWLTFCRTIYYPLIELMKLFKIIR